MSKLDLLTPENSALIFIDHQPQMTFGVQSIDRQSLFNNVLGLAKSSRVYNIPTVLTAVESKSFSGHIWPELLDVFPKHDVIERTSMNSWEDENFRKAIEATGRKKLVFCALWTEVCLAFPVVEAVRDGYEVYFVTDASGGTSKEAHDMAVQRMIQAGAIPMTWVQTALEWQRDWSRKETYDGIINVMREHAGAYGQGIEYAYTMVHNAPPNRKNVEG
ncbi:MAG: hydrolase [Deltaproteobacteria bacterium]|nr:MAG: hydrolase [Deltaproteobacteria bacterium]